MTEEVIIRKEGRVGRITLNRPKALHAVTLGICEAVIAAILAWEKDGTALVLIDHSEGRGFSAGGDIRWLAEKIVADPALAKRFFFTEYQMNHLLFTSPLPIVAFMDGVVMGGGAGLALPCRYRGATENTKFAMPEAGIGLFPDVGGGWSLPRLPDGLGLHLATTGDRLEGAACVEVGVATHFAGSATLVGLKNELTKSPGAVQEILGDASSSSSPAQRERRGDPRASSCVGGGEGGAFGAQKSPPSPPPIAKTQWVRSQARPLPRRAGEEVDSKIAKKSPLSLRVLARQLELGAQAKTFADVMRMEYRIASRIIFEPDFAEGIRAFIIDKDQSPRWSSTAATDYFFAPLPPHEEWTPMTRT